MEKKYRALGYFFLILIPLVFFGFYKTYFIQFPTFRDVKHNYIHIHAAIAIIWVLLIIVQPFLIVNKKFSWHRKLGKLSYLIFPLLILSFIPMVLNNLNSDTPENAFFPIGDGTLLVLFYSLAIYNRKKTALHMRYMIAAALVLFGPTVGRILPNLLGFGAIATQNIQFTIIQSILIALVLFDKTNNRKYFPYLLSITGWCVHQFIFYCLFLF
jgi:hypothetical protein